MLEVFLPWPPTQLNPNKRVHWSVKAKHAARYREQCAWLAKEAKLRVDWPGDIHVWVDFFPPDKRRRDDDNLVAAFKAGRDGLADALGVEDSRFRTHPYLRTDTGGCVRVRLTHGPDLVLPVKGEVS